MSKTDEHIRTAIDQLEAADRLSECREQWLAFHRAAAVVHMLGAATSAIQENTAMLGVLAAAIRDANSDPAKKPPGDAHGATPGEPATGGTAALFEPATPPPSGERGNHTDA